MFNKFSGMLYIPVLLVLDHRGTNVHKTKKRYIGIHFSVLYTLGGLSSKYIIYKRVSI